MPKKIEPEKNKKFESESSEGEGVSGSETGSDHEQFQIHQRIQSLPNSVVKKVGIEPSSSIAQKKSVSSSSGEEDESGSESESEGAEVGVVPLPAKRGDSPQKSGAAGGKHIPKDLEHATPPKKAGGKRTTEGLDTKGGKKAKKADAGLAKSHGEPEATSSKKKLELSTKGEKSVMKLELSTKGEKSVNDDTKKQLFQRIWSEDDEIVVLKGMVDYTEKKISDPVLDLDAFREFIKDNLHFDVSRSQLQDKIRRLKKKYLKNKTKEVEGTDQKFSKPHEQQAYKLSKEVWGKKNVYSVVGSPKPRSSVARKRQTKTQTENGNHGKCEETKMENLENGKPEDISMVDLVNGDSDTVVRTLEFASGDTDSIFPSSSQNTGIESLIRSIGTKLYERDGIVKGTKEWRKLALEEIELYDQKLTLMSARAKLVIRGLKYRNAVVEKPFPMV